MVRQQLYLFHNYSVIYTCNSKHSLYLSFCLEIIVPLLYFVLIFCAVIADLLQLAMSMFQPHCIITLDKNSLGGNHFEKLLISVLLLRMPLRFWFSPQIPCEVFVPAIGQPMKFVLQCSGLFL